MKSAANWIKYCGEQPSPWFEWFLQEVQLDAFKAGMTAAAELLHDENSTKESLKRRWRDEIAKARDSKKTV